MANKQDFTTFFKTAPAAFNTAAVTDAWKTWATFGERFSAIALDAANKSNDVTTNTVKESLKLLRDVTSAQNAPTDYTKVVSDFGTSQAELVKTHFQALGDVAKLAQNDATELLSTTGQHITEQGSKAANAAQASAKAASGKNARAA
ncbi:Phasin [Meridianimarinicoccus roseus]|uniref:Phasin n=1 Tax=Meridianimarinicoccus roseus TaxID=2072018 RepID=A0A2V2L9T1_9RHOB|nr:Phasin [Meridianimarinicoccus roseus]PWR02055.1 Phasin [Meridianimarinicoccus roseus]